MIIFNFLFNVYFRLFLEFHFIFQSFINRFFENLLFIEYLNIIIHNFRFIIYIIVGSFTSVLIIDYFFIYLLKYHYLSNVKKLFIFSYLIHVYNIYAKTKITEKFTELTDGSASCIEKIIRSTIYICIYKYYNDDIIFMFYYPIKQDNFHQNFFHERVKQKEYMHNIEIFWLLQNTY